MKHLSRQRTGIVVATALLAAASVFGCKNAEPDKYSRNELLAAFQKTAVCAWVDPSNKFSTVDHDPTLYIRIASAMANKTGKPLLIPVQDVDGYTFMGGKTIEGTSVHVSVPKKDGTDKFNVTYTDSDTNSSASVVLPPCE